MNPKLWEIWNLNQLAARTSGKIPIQPNDPKELERRYLIIADPKKRSTSTCCPIQEFVGKRLILQTEVFLPKNYGKFITKDCVIVCHEIYTLDNYYFTNNLGKLQTVEINSVCDALFEFLNI